MRRLTGPDAGTEAEFIVWISYPIRLAQAARGVGDSVERREACGGRFARQERVVVDIIRQSSHQQVISSDRPALRPTLRPVSCSCRETAHPVWASASKRALRCRMRRFPEARW
jgi:hypothetical protein